MRNLKALFILFTMAVLLLCFAGCLSNAKSDENLFKTNFLVNYINYIKYQLIIIKFKLIFLIFISTPCFGRNENNNQFVNQNFLILISFNNFIRYFSISFLKIFLKMNILLIKSLESLIACQFQTDMNNDFNDFIA